MAETLKVVPSRTKERQRVADEVGDPAAEVQPHDAAIALRLERLAEAVQLGRPDDARASGSRRRDVLRETRRSSLLWLCMPRAKTIGDPDAGRWQVRSERGSVETGRVALPRH